MFPVRVQKAITRLQPPGRPDIEAKYHNSMEQGRFLERPLGDAMSTLKQREKDLQEKINHYMSLNVLATDGQFPDSVRPAKYVVDSVKFIKQVQDYTQETMNIVKAINETIGMYVSLKNNIQGYFQERSNALATLINEICNFSLPSLPSIPNFFGNFTFDGFNFPKGQFNFKISFDKNFAYGQCHLRGGDVNIFRNYPKTMNWNGIPTTIPVYRPPFAGYLNVPPVPNVGSIQDTAYYSSFDPNTDFYQGSGFPDPKFIVSDYRIPVEEFVTRLSSLTGQTTSLGDVDSTADPNYMVAWLQLLKENRNLRAGQWLPNFQQVYDTYITPSVTYVQTNKVLWNNKEGGSGVPNAGDQNIPLLKFFREGNALTVGKVKYMLSYVESSLLGVTRNKNFDSYLLESGSPVDAQAASFLSTYTKDDLDYRETTLSTEIIKIALESDGKAIYPVYLNVPSNLYDMMLSVVSKLSLDIEATTTYISSRAKNRYIYDNFGEQQFIDKYSQFWRDVVDNWNELISLSDPSYKYVLSYQEAVYDYINPLIKTKTIYPVIKADSDSRSSSWFPGQYKLPIFVQDPLELYPPSQIADPADVWEGDVFLEDKFLLRADIQGLTLSQKLAMLQINRAYSDLKLSTQEMIASIDTAVSNAQSGMKGFYYKTQATPVAGILQSGSDVSLPVLDFDTTSANTDGIRFKIPQDGSYSLSASVDWLGTDFGTRMLILIKNDAYVLDTIQVGPGFAPVTTKLDIIKDLKANDLIKIRIQHNCDNYQSITNGFLSASLVGSTGSTPSAPETGTGGSGSGSGSGGSLTNTVMRTAADNIYTGMCVKINSDGTVSPLSVTSTSAIPFVDGIALNDAGFGGNVEVAIYHGAIYTITGATFLPGPVFVGINSVLTQTQPTTGGGYSWYVQVGRALTVDTVLLNAQLPIQLQ